MEVLFGAILLMGVAYLMLMILSGIGHSTDFGVDGLMHDLHLDALFGLDMDGAGEATGIGCSVIAAFMAGFGAVGLTATRLGWPVLIVLIVSLGLGYLLAFAVARFMRFVMASQSTERFSIQELVGVNARVTINTPSGETGEVMIESGQMLKFAVREINGAELKRGDVVTIVDVDGTQLRVKKKQQETF